MRLSSLSLPPARLPVIRVPAPSKRVARVVRQVDTLLRGMVVRDFLLPTDHLLVGGHSDVVVAMRSIGIPHEEDLGDLDGLGPTLLSDEGGTKVHVRGLEVRV
eukprot:CAMPEP_0180580936 /NCGR_PEP_ID=MMETSP1037_2-20121125/13790_1 /TAXON_ID=632150 /ORGANISM="Azadinium spinosum, Strain 3D9" /LENGTH=102 /DNA_ID=CAMNT_0022598897 /DNA_START=78 /DNA_END=386 /DNA_ORIENTATION=-